MPGSTSFSFEDKPPSKLSKIGRGTVKEEQLLANTEPVSAEPEAPPFDPSLPGTALLHQPSQLSEKVSPLLGDWLGPGATLLDSRVAIRRIVPGQRCTAELELTLGLERGAPAVHRRLVAKIYSEDQGTKVYETLRELRCHGFGKGRFIVPQPLAYDPACHLLLLDWAEGELLSALILASPSVSQRIEGAAAWLLRLHTCGVTSGRRYTFSRHLHTLAIWKQQLTDVFPESEHRLSDLLGWMEERGRALSDWTPGPTHRDYSPEHLVVNGDQLAGLDFDEFCQYDPLFDVAHFAAHLRFLGLTYFGSLRRFDWLAARFQASYQGGTREYSAERVCLYEAISYFKLARIVALVQRPKAWKWIGAALLREASLVL